MQNILLTYFQKKRLQKMKCLLQHIDGYMLFQVLKDYLSFIEF